MKMDKQVQVQGTLEKEDLVVSVAMQGMRRMLKKGVQNRRGGAGQFKKKLSVY